MISSWRRISIAGAVLLSALAGAAPAQTPSIGTGSIARLLTEGWQIAGYIAVSELRTLILFRHADIRHLVQCSVLTDVTQKERVRIACYELH